MYRGRTPLTPLIRSRRRQLPLSGFVPSLPPELHRPDRITLVTLNTWKGEGDYAKRVAAMGSLLAGLDADIVLLQEVLAVPEQGVNTAFALARDLGLYATYHPAREKRRTVEGRRIVCQSGMAILSRHPIRSSSAIQLPADGRDGERIAQVAALDIGAPLNVLNVHLSHLKGARDLRQRQFAAALRGLPDDSSSASLVGGDFNEYVDEEWVSSLAKTAGLSIQNSRWAAPDLSAAPTLIGFDPMDDTPQARCLDHVLLVHASNVPAKRVTDLSHHGDAFASDHMAVRSTVMWPDLAA